MSVVVRVRVSVFVGSIVCVHPVFVLSVLSVIIVMSLCSVIECVFVVSPVYVSVFRVVIVTIVTFSHIVNVSCSKEGGGGIISRIFSPSLLRLRLRDLALGLLTMFESPGCLGRAPVRRGERYALVTPLKVGGGILAFAALR